MNTLKWGLLVVATLTSAAPAAAQDPEAARRDSAIKRLGGGYYGPRIGITFLSNGVVKKLDDHGLHTAPFILQFGWQWERRFVISAEAPVLASGLVFLVGGAEQGVLLPSLAWIIGMRSPKGGEFGLGPVVALSGANLAIAFGGTKQAGEVNIPINFVIVPGKPGARISFLTGFNMSRRRLQD